VHDHAAGSARAERATDDDGPARRRLTGGLLTLALLAPTVLLLRAPFQHWFPSGDAALLALNARDVFSAHTPLVGSSSHFGWAHPGPLLLGVLAVPYRVFGLRTEGLLVGALLVNAAAIVTLVARLLRTGGAVVACAGGAAVTLLVWSMGTGKLWSIGNADVTVLPFVALVVVVWTMRVDAAADLPLVALLGSFLAQTDAAYVPMVGVLVVVSVWTRVAQRRVQAGGTRRTELVAALAVVVVAWAPVVVDALTNGGGNVRELWRFWFSRHDHAGLVTALRVVGQEFSLHGRFLGGHPPLVLGAVAPRGVPVPVSLLVLLAATVLAGRRHDPFVLRACAIVWLLIAAAVVSTAGIGGTVYPYPVGFLPALVACCWIVSLTAVVRAVQDRSNQRQRRVAPTLVAATAATLALVTAVSAMRARPGDAAEVRTSRDLAVVTPELRAAVGPPSRRLDVRASGSSGAAVVEAGIVLDLVAHGYDVRTADGDRFGHRAAPEPLTRPLVVTAGSDDFQRHAFAYTPLARSGPPALWPPAAPPARRGESPAEYLERIRPRLTASELRAVQRFLDSTSPVTVFGATPR
jgi:hypothetical protein